MGDVLNKAAEAAQRFLYCLKDYVDARNHKKWADCCIERAALERARLDIRRLCGSPVKDALYGRGSY